MVFVSRRFGRDLGGQVDVLVRGWLRGGSFVASSDLNVTGGVFEASGGELLTSRKGLEVLYVVGRK